MMRDTEKSIQYIIPPEQDGETVEKIARKHFLISRHQLSRMKFDGGLLLDEKPVRSIDRVHTGQTLNLLIYPKDKAPCAAYDLPLDILYEDSDLLIVNKPAPLPSVQSRYQKTQTLENAVRAYLSPDGSAFSYHPVNRLDKGTSGVMVIAKNAHIQQLLQKELHTDNFLREYIALTDGKIPDACGCITFPIARVDNASAKRTVSPEGKECKTCYQVLWENAEHSLVRLRLETGRTHQIRVHLSALSCPVTGDYLYGTERPELNGRFLLHSEKLTLKHPLTGETLVVTAPLPKEFSLYIK